MVTAMVALLAALLAIAGCGWFSIPREKFDALDEQLTLTKGASNFYCESGRWPQNLDELSQALRGSGAFDWDVIDRAEFVVLESGELGIRYVNGTTGRESIANIAPPLSCGSSWQS
jgi:hypothetical protein